MDRSCSEKISIRDSNKSLKKYGSTSNKHFTKNETYIKHSVVETDTLQGIALKYDVTVEQIRRANKLWSDSIFLKELLIPSKKYEPGLNLQSNKETNSLSTSQSETNFSDTDIVDVDEVLGKIDASINSTKADIRKTQKNSVGHQFLNALNHDC